MKLDFLADPTPHQVDLVAEFGAWRAAHDLAPAADDELMLTQLLARDGRRWLLNFLARWDWAGEDAAREPGALCTPLELAGEVMRVVRENSSRGEFADIVAGRRAVSDVLHIGSVVDQAFARAHHVALGGRRTPKQHQAEEALKSEAISLVGIANERAKGLL